MRIAPRKLNLRTEPLVKPSTLIVGLPFGHEVDVTGNSHRAGWKLVKTNYRGRDLSGHISGKYLRADESAAKEAALAEAAKEWDRFERGAGKETIAPYYGYVGEMWRRRGLPHDGRNTSQYWSAACISFILENGGYQNFKFAIAHAKYINDAIVARETGDSSRDFWGFRPSEHKPAIGDLVARRRTNATYLDYDYAKNHDAFPSHTDLVVSVGDEFVDAVGGNVANSVSITRYRRVASGLINTRGGRIFAVLRNNR